MSRFQRMALPGKPADEELFMRRPLGHIGRIVLPEVSHPIGGRAKDLVGIGNGYRADHGPQA
jgi:hypothetical protein